MPLRAIMKVTDRLGCLLGTGVPLSPDEVIEAAFNVALGITLVAKALDLDRSGF